MPLSMKDPLVVSEITYLCSFQCEHVDRVIAARGD